MKKMKWIGMALAALAIGCTDNQALLQSKDWQMKHMVLNGDTLQNPAALPVLQFTDSVTIAGSGGCNRFFGKYTLDKEGSMTIKVSGATLMYCPDMAFEDAYMKALPTVAHYELSANALTLTDEEGTCTIAYEAIEKTEE